MFEPSYMVDGVEWSRGTRGGLRVDNGTSIPYKITIQTRDYRRVQRRGIPMTEKYKVKVCLAGREGVGKTSLIRRFVQDEFDDAYRSTLGANVTRHLLQLDREDIAEPVEVTLAIWDIMGQQPFLQLLKEAYFDGADVVIAVCDLTRPDTLEGLKSWMHDIRNVTGPVPVLFAGNKADLVEERLVSDEELEEAAGPAPSFVTSAKTGERVEDAFRGVARYHVSTSRLGRSLMTTGYPITAWDIDGYG